MDLIRAIMEEVAAFDDLLAAVIREIRAESGPAFDEAFYRQLVAASPDVTAFEAFVDGVMAAQFEALELVGAVVTVVEVGGPRFSKGYGYTDPTSGTPVDPDRTLFRIGSITKLFVWTAVMQLVEQGALDLNEDVNTYPSAVRAPATCLEPMTVAHLMAHAAGFEDRSVGLFARTPDAVQPLAELLSGGLPERVRPVDEVATYSNHGAALAFLASLAVVIRDPMEIAFGVPPLLRVVHGIGLAGSAGNSSGCPWSCARGSAGRGASPGASTTAP